MIRIIAGKHKGRVIPTIKSADYRPSTGKFREALFSILTSGEFVKDEILQNAKILDLYSGTGSLSFEALSRGALSATLVDINQEYLKAAKQFSEKIGEVETTQFLKLSATSLPFSGRQYNLVFMDPPYAKNFINKTINSLIKNKWLENQAIIIADSDIREEISSNNKLEIIDQRNYGNSKMIILKFENQPTKD